MLAAAISQHLTPHNSHDTIHLKTTSPETDPPGPGKLIKAKEMNAYVTAYKDRVIAVEQAFGQLPPTYPPPFDVAQEAHGWLFNREVIDMFLKTTARDAEFIAFVFGVGPKEHDDDGRSVPGCPDVLHVIMTPATKHQPAIESDINKNMDTFSIPLLQQAMLHGDDDVAAEHGTACCHGNQLFCIDQLLTEGTVTTKKV